MRVGQSSTMYCCNTMHVYIVRVPKSHTSTIHDLCILLHRAISFDVFVIYSHYTTELTQQNELSVLL